jgi:hypothetical protein
VWEFLSRRRRARNNKNPPLGGRRPTRGLLPRQELKTSSKRSEEISQIWLVWGKAVALSRYH